MGLKKPRFVPAYLSACAGDETQRLPPAVFELSTAELHAGETHIDIQHIKQEG